MPQNFLEKIRPEIEASVRQLKTERPSSEWEERALQRTIQADFHAALSTPGEWRIIAEIKKASPSRGIIRDDFNPLSLARSYERQGAAALSVLTEEKYFLGSIRILAQVAMASSLPVLRKDFILDEVQIAQARSNGAAAVLLIAAFLTPRRLAELLAACRHYALAALVEVHDEEELTQANDAGAQIIGVNNRNLKTLEVDLQVSERLISQKRSAQIFVAESGLTSQAQLKRLRAAGYDAFLMGEHFMKAADPGLELGRIRGMA